MSRPARRTGGLLRGAPECTSPGPRCDSPSAFFRSAFFRSGAWGVVVAIGIVTGVSMLSGCDSPTRPTEPGANVRVALARKSQPRNRTIAYSLFEAASDLEVAIEVEFFDDPRKQRERVDAWIETGVSAIVVQPIDDTDWESPLRRAQERRIVVVTVDRPVQPSLADLVGCHVGPDPEEQGMQAARAVRDVLAELAREASEVSTSGSESEEAAADPTRSRVIMIPGPDDATTRARSRGFISAISRVEGAELLPPVERSHFEAAPASVLDPLCDEAAPGRLAVEVVVVQSATDAAIWLDTLRQAKLRPGRAVHTVCIGADSNALLDLDSGALSACVEDDPLLGPVAIERVQRLLRRLPVPRIARVPSPIITSEHALNLLAVRRY